MSRIDFFNKNDLLYILECKKLSPAIVFDNILVIFHSGKIIFAKKISDLFINDLCDLGIDVTDNRFVHYLVDIARDNVEGKRKSLTL